MDGNRHDPPQRGARLAHYASGDRDVVWLVSVETFSVDAPEPRHLDDLGPAKGVDAVLILDRDGNGATLYGRGRDLAEMIFYLAPVFLGGIANASGAQVIGWVAPQLIALAISIWAFVEPGCLKYTQGKNRFGINPLPDFSE